MSSIAIWVWGSFNNKVVRCIHGSPSRVIVTRSARLRAVGARRLSNGRTRRSWRRRTSKRNPIRIRNVLRARRSCPAAALIVRRIPLPEIARVVQATSRRTFVDCESVTDRIEAIALRASNVFAESAEARAWISYSSYRHCNIR